MKKLVSVLLLLALLLQLVPLTAAWAAEAKADVVDTEVDLGERPLERSGTRAVNHTPTSAAADLRQNMVNRTPVINVDLFVTNREDAPSGTELLALAEAHTGVPDEGDYLHKQRGGLDIYRSWASVDGGWVCTYILPSPYDPDNTTFPYYTTAAEEKELASKISGALSSLKLDGKSDYQKVAAIYEYICKNVSYDTSHLNDTSYKPQFTAYAALCKGKAVCQGYALLLYRMLLTCGIDCRVISGKADNGTGTYVSHAWNIVKLGDLYYNLDVTFDDTMGNTASNYKFFLKGSNTFSGHNRSEEFNTAEFNAAYPMSKKDYDPGSQPPEPLPTQFVDVPNGAYFVDPVLWAVGKGVTNGIDSKHFGPDQKCTRAQVVTFLWRAKGSPAVGTVVDENELPILPINSFSDVDERAYYYTAVLWAVENNITQGTGNGKFSPDATCTRGQVVTFLWRTEGEPAPASSNNPFSDVRTNDFFYSAVLWAVEHNITNGLDNTHFGPYSKCTRAQVVTFLYRDLA